MKKSSEVLVILLIIILLVVIGIGGYFIYQLNNKIDEKSDEIASLKSSQRTANNEQENINKTSNEDSEKLNEKEALKIGKGLYDDVLGISWGEGVEYVSEDELGVVPKYIEINSIQYTIIKNSEEIMNKFTKNGEKELCEILGIIIKDGKYLQASTGRGSDIYYLSTELKVLNILADEITFNAISSYGAPEADMELPEDIEETKTDKFVIKKENGIWKVDSFVVPN